MAPLLDIRTLSFASALVKAIIFVYMLHLWLTRKTYPGFGQWTLAALLHLLGLTFLALRGCGARLAVHRACQPVHNIKRLVDRPRSGHLRRPACQPLAGHLDHDGLGGLV